MTNCVYCTLPYEGVLGEAFRHEQEFVQAMIVVPPLVAALDFLYRNVPCSEEAYQRAAERLQFLARKPDEASSDYFKRMAPLFATAVGCGALLTVPYLAAPSIAVGSFEIPTIALSSLAASGLLCARVEGQELVGRLNTLLRVREGANLREESIRIAHNAMLLTLSTGFLVLAAIYSPQILEKSSEYRVWLPFQNNATVTAEYVLLAAVHGFESFRLLSKSKNALGAYHLVNSCLTLLFGLAILCSPGTKRMHHSWYAQALKLAPSSIVKALGASLAISSLVYQFVGNPGYESYYDCDGDQILLEENVFGFDNIVLDHLEIIFLGLVSVAIEQANRALAKALFRPIQF